MIPRIRTLRTFLLCLLGLALTTALSAQVSRGTINGRVTDATGAVVSGAHLVATETATGSTYTTDSNGDGQYTIPFLAPGNYRVAATAAGFKTSVHDHVIVDANVHVTVDITMDIGTVAESVTVSADNALIETTIASTGQVLDKEDIENMPVNGRTPMILGQLAYGAISTGNPTFNHPFDNSGPSSISLGGGASKKNEILIDGSPDGGADGTLAFSPPMDAMQEVKVETFQADAAYGHTAGGTINHVTRSGTNDYHGSAYEFLQVSALNDTPYFNKHVTPQKRKSVTHFNQWGGTFGGPISIPHLYNGRDKLFLFFAYEGISDNNPSPSVLSVPTEAERNGDFSALLPQGIVIYDPATGVKDNKGRVVRQPFPNNVIPQNRLDKVGMNLASYFAKPNIQTSNADGESNYFYPGNSTDKFDSEMGRIDANLARNDKGFFAFRHNDRYHASGNAFNNIATGSVLIQPNWGATLDEVHTFSMNTIWDNRFNWTRNTESRPLAVNFDFSQLGFPPELAAASTAQGFPVTSGTKFVDFGYSKGDYIPYDSFQYFSMLSHVVGKHSLEFGADLRLNREYSFRYGNSSGLYQFSLNGGQGWTNGPYNSSSAANGVGQELASMLLGLPTTGSFDINGKQISQAKYYALFVQDNYRILKNLTLNLGLRYERDLPTIERHNEGVVGFDTTATNPVNAQAQANFAASPVAGVNFPATLTGGLVFAGPNNRAMYQTAATNFSPRIGFAYSPQATMSIRGGFGIFNDSVGRNDPIATGFNQTTQLQASQDGYLTPYGTLDDPFPTGLLLPPGNSLGLATNLGQSVSFYPHKLLNDYAERWDLDLQQQLPGNVLFEMGYVGEHGLHVGVSRNINYIPAQYLNVGQYRDPVSYANLTANVANPFRGIAGSSMNGATVQRQQLLLPYPEFTSVTMSSYPAGGSSFNALEARLEKRMAHGVRFLVNYEWSKRFESVAYLNAQDVKPEKRIASDDRPQHLVATGTWELPFGQGRRYRVDVPVAGYLVSGWNLTSIFTFQPDGAPLSWGDVIYKGSNLNDLKVNPHSPDGAFDITQFDGKSAQPVAGYHIRTLPTQVTHARQDGIVALDMSIIKNNRITEKLNAQIRADFFNALNHPQFSAPNLSPTSKTFGTITSQANLPRTIQLGVRLAF